LGKRNERQVMTVKPLHTTEIKPGVHVDMHDYGRQPDQGVTDMSDLDRNLVKARQSAAGKLNLGERTNG
jgi:hypothetical protein